MVQSLEKLRSAGIALDQLPPEAQKALEDLSAEEVDTVIKVHERIRSAGNEVEGFAMRAEGSNGYVGF